MGTEYDLRMILIAIGILAVIFVGIIAMLMRFYRKVDQGHALIVNTMRAEPVVTFTGRIVVPIIHRAEVMDISVKTIELERRGKEGLICRDNIRADIKTTFFVRVNKKTDDVLKVAQSIGCARASDPETLERLFVAKFSEALKTVGKRLDFEELYTKRNEFKDEIIEVIGQYLNGYWLDDAAIDYLEQTPVATLDPMNILDAQGIRKITQITAEQNVRTNDLRQEEKKAIRRKDVEAAEALLELDRQEQEARAKQAREVATLQAREQAQVLTVQAEEKRKAELARLKQEEEVSVQEQNKDRQIDIAQKNRERAVAVETERVEKERSLEAIAREREVELNRIEKEKALEVEKKNIADVIAGRIAVEKNVAEEEERIKDLRVVAEAKRIKEAKVITAEAAAQEKLVLSIKEAEASEQAAGFKAKERLVLADAELEASDREARAKIRIAEGTQAEYAAEGLAQVKVKEADASATEKHGMAELRVKDAEAGVVERRGKAEAEAKKMMLVAEAEGEQSRAAAVQKVGQAEASARREMLVAEAEGEQARAGAIQQVGAAEASAVKDKMEAEAAGLQQKAQAMRALEGETREHEEFRMRLEKALEVEQARLVAQQAIAAEQARVLGKAMEAAKINIVGGDGQFLQQFFRAVSLGQSLDGAIHNSDTLGSVSSEYLTGSASLREDLRDVLAGSTVTPENLKNLSIARALHLLTQGEKDESRKAKWQELLRQAETLGLT